MIETNDLEITFLSSAISSRGKMNTVSTKDIVIQTISNFIAELPFPRLHGLIQPGYQGSNLIFYIRIALSIHSNQPYLLTDPIHPINSPPGIYFTGYDPDGAQGIVSEHLNTWLNGPLAQCCGSYVNGIMRVKASTPGAVLVINPFFDIDLV